ncbi:hypothetical protein E2C01_027183 [Portunus trituberculatus]|uniref:Uncharacterized protein n=1 Tax=Portunus trituberculatus TaxID=210409 RepID=A0A5B7EKG0_PORTR|nr:hypothetical protein [Portunus trituberculatus]
MGKGEIREEQWRGDKSGSVPRISMRGAKPAGAMASSCTYGLPDAGEKRDAYILSTIGWHMAVPPVIIMRNR